MGEIGHRNVTELHSHHTSATRYFIRTIIWSLFLSVKPFFTWIKATLGGAKCGPLWSLCHVVRGSEGLSLGQQRVESVIVDPRPPFSSNQKLSTHITELLVLLLSFYSHHTRQLLCKFASPTRDSDAKFYCLQALADSN